MKDKQLVKISLVIMAGICIISAAAAKKNPVFTVDDDKLVKIASAIILKHFDQNAGTVSF